MKTVKKTVEIIEKVIDLFLGEDKTTAYLQKMKDNTLRYL